MHDDDRDIFRRKQEINLNAQAIDQTDDPFEKVRLFLEKQELQAIGEESNRNKKKGNRSKIDVSRLSSRLNPKSHESTAEKELSMENYDELIAQAEATNRSSSAMANKLLNLDVAKARCNQNSSRGNSSRRQMKSLNNSMAAIV